VNAARALFDSALVKALMKRLKGLQEDLGYVNDVRTAQGLIRELGWSAEHEVTDVALAAGWSLVSTSAS